MAQLAEAVAANNARCICRVVLIMCGFCVFFRMVTVTALCKISWQKR